jgi:hypothetical protein
VIRLPAKVIERLDQIAARLSAAGSDAPGRSCSRAEVVRALITAELAMTEQDGQKFEELARRAIPPRSRRKHTANALRSTVTSTAGTVPPPR